MRNPPLPFLSFISPLMHIQAGFFERGHIPPSPYPVSTYTPELQQPDISLIPSHSFFNRPTQPHGSPSHSHVHSNILCGRQGAKAAGLETLNTYTLMAAWCNENEADNLIPS